MTKLVKPFERTFASHPRSQFWNYEKNIGNPSEYALNSHKKCWFNCVDCSHQYISTLNNITALNNGMAEYQGTMMFTSHDHELVNTVANRIVEITPNGIIDKMMPYDDYLADPKIAQLQEELY